MPGSADRLRSTGTAPRGDSGEAIWADLVEGNTRFVAGTPRERNLVRARHELAKGQTCPVIVLGCADSRVSPTLVFDKNLGDLFEVRTAGHITDPVVLGSLEYAAEYLRSPVLVVLGHEGCGAVIAAASGEKPASPNLRAIVDRIAPAAWNVGEDARGDERLRRSVEASMHQSVADILERSAIIRRAVDEKRLAIIKAVYRIETGEVVRLGSEGPGLARPGPCRRQWRVPEGVKRIAGVGLIALGIVGMVLPLIPGTPLVLAGAALLGAEHSLLRPLVRRLRGGRAIERDPRQ